MCTHRVYSFVYTIHYNIQNAAGHVVKLPSVAALVPLLVYNLCAAVARWRRTHQTAPLLNLYKNKTEA